MAGSIDLLRGETKGLAIDATSGFPGDVSIKDTVTPANNRVNSPLNSVLTNTNASTKVTLKSDLTLATTAANKVAQEWDVANSKWAILCEAAATNLQFHSQNLDLGNGTWSDAGGNLSKSLDAIAAPDGTTTADLISTTNSNAGVMVTANIGALSTSTDYTVSAYVKRQSGLTHLMFGLTNGVAQGQYTWFNVSTGAVGSSGDAHLTSSWTNNGGTITALANGWYRITKSLTTSGSVGNGSLEIWYVDADGGTGNPGTTCGMYIWGAQCELGTVATSYIATTTAAVTRATDNITLATSAFPYADGPGTVYCDFKIRTSASDRFLWELSKDTSNAIEARVDNNNGGLEGRYEIATTVTFATDTGAVTINARNQHTHGWATNDIDSSDDGSTLSSDASQALPTGITTLSLGCGIAAPDVALNGLIYRFVYVPYQRQTVSGDLVTWRYNFTGVGVAVGPTFSGGNTSFQPKTTMVGY